MHRVLLALALVSASAACSSKGEAPAPAGYQALGKKPANARRPMAPPGIEAKALAVGAKVPMIEVTDATGAPWRLADALSKHARVMLLFYRGDW